jgi:hypothetical protein
LRVRTGITNSGALGWSPAAISARRASWSDSAREHFGPISTRRNLSDFVEPFVVCLVAERLRER